MKRDPAHEAARELLVRLAAGSELLYLFWPALLGYLPIVTHESDPAAAACTAPRRAQRGAAAGTVARARGGPGGRVLAALRGAVAGDHPRANDVPDAHPAAFLRQHEVRVIYAHERDFRRFEGIEMRDPAG